MGSERAVWRGWSGGGDGGGLGQEKGLDPADWCLPPLHTHKAKHEAVPLWESNVTACLCTSLRPKP